ncbi:hypothetical protein LEP1GSC047_1034 [Leptospira inadai serovar Lyme str. 10]|uniref:Uncharacterized protein n=1 Tax=Leptospira inadai serovar Lyme str. 10 TaxID=1049790 RepID=V6HR66_9LEPT|nr:hypothetical protein LEP1GSC047_1034 [Leptospira inadai serovar Lyme str. 10]
MLAFHGIKYRKKVVPNMVTLYIYSCEDYFQEDFERFL